MEKRKVHVFREEGQKYWGWMNKPSNDDTLDQARRFLVAGVHTWRGATMSLRVLALENQRERSAS